MSFCITEENITFLEKLQKQYPDSSKRTLLSWIKNGKFLLDERPINKSFITLKKGQKISLKKKENLLPGNVKLVYEDPYLVIIDKPAGLLSVPKDTPMSFNALKILRKHFNTKNIFAVHRIDQGASGLLMFAKSKESLDKLKELFKTKKQNLERIYLAVVKGNFEKEKGTFINYLRERKDLKVCCTNKHFGELAITDFKTLYRNKTYSFISLKLQTGKKHQIRVQMADNGFPLLGDKKYGEKDATRKRMYLHACSLNFTHPFYKKKMCFFSFPPKEFYDLGISKITDILPKTWL